MPRTLKTASNGGVVKLPPGVKRVRTKLADGTRRIYYYRNGHRLLGFPGSPGFDESYARASRPAGEEPSDTIKALLAKFTASPEAHEASENSIQQRQRYLDMIEDEFGHMTLEDIQDDRACRVFYDWRDRFVATPVLGDAALQTLKQVVKWAKKRKLIRINQAEDVDKLVGKRERRIRNRAAMVFTPKMEAEILRRVRPCVADAFLLALYTAAREGDLCALRRDMIDADGWLHYTPSKTEHSTGVTVHLPVFALPPLKALLDRLPRWPHGFILAGVLGGPLAVSTLQDHWRQDRDKFTKIRLHWHDIRGTAITRMRMAGCTDIEAAAISGHAHARGTEIPSLGHYETPNPPMALNAYSKWAAAEFPGGGRVVRLRTIGA